METLQETTVSKYVVFLMLSTSEVYGYPQQVLYLHNIM